MTRRMSSSDYRAMLGSGSELELSLLLQLRDYGLPDQEREYIFHSPRRWRFDMAWPDRWLAVEE